MIQWTLQKKNKSNFQELREAIQKTEDAKEYFCNTTLLLTWLRKIKLMDILHYALT